MNKPTPTTLLLACLGIEQHLITGPRRIERLVLDLQILAGAAHQFQHVAVLVIGRQQRPHREAARFVPRPKVAPRRHRCALGQQ